MKNVLFGALSALALTAVPAAAHEDEAACDKPVIMVVTGTTLDIDRMRAYAQAIADSGVYQELGGYYLNIPAPLAHLEGAAPDGHTTLLVRFPCLANAEAFWYSRVYQEDIIPMRLNPSAGDYFVHVYPEAPVRADIVGKVDSNAYTQPFSTDNVPQIERETE